MSIIWLICQYATTPDVGGYLRHHYLGRELAKAGHDVYVIGSRVHHMMTHPDRSRAAPFMEKVGGYTMVRLDTSAYPHAHHKKRILGWAQFGWQLPWLAQRGLPKPDTVLYSSPNLLSFPGAERAARKAGARLVFEVRDIWPLSMIHIGNVSPKHPFARLLQWIEDRAYRVSDKVVSNLPNAVEHMVSRGMDRAKFHWIPNGVDLSDNALQEPLPGAVQAQLPVDRFITGYAGTHGEANNLDTLLDAAAQLRDRDDLAFVLVGDGKQKAVLKARAKSEGLDNVTFIDPIPKTQVQSMLARFDACFIGLPPGPLFRFGVSPNKLFDYLGAAKPVIYAVDSGDYNIVRAHEAGLSIPPCDPEAIAQAVTQLQALTAEDRAAMGQRGLACVKTDYDFLTLGRLLDAVLTG